ncbi:hypothetical protein RCH07_001581 [Arthrobacter sp. CG_A4]|nr:hypothetical protein [Arthrobacter sp. CG_A4]
MIPRNMGAKSHLDGAASACPRLPAPAPAPARACTPAQAYLAYRSTKFRRIFIGSVTLCCRARSISSSAESGGK